MQFDTPGALARIVTVLKGLNGMGVVGEGSPDLIKSGIGAYVFLMRQEVTDKATSLLQQRSAFFIGIGYRVGGSEAHAERQSVALVDAFTEAFYAERATDLAGNATSIELDKTIGDTRPYTDWVGEEYRVFPMVLTVVQQSTF